MNEDDVSILQLMNSESYRYYYEQEMRKNEELMRKIEIENCIKEYHENNPLFI